MENHEPSVTAVNVLQYHTSKPQTSEHKASSLSDVKKLISLTSDHRPGTESTVYRARSLTGHTVAAYFTPARHPVSLRTVTTRKLKRQINPAAVTKLRAQIAQ